MRNIKSFNINFERTETLKKFECRKFDDLTLKIKVLDNNSIMIPSNQDIRFYLRKSDKTILYQEDGINVNPDTGIITINVHNQATACEGMVLASLEFKDSLGKTSTSLFVFEVKESINIDEALESVDEIQGLDAIKEFVNETRPEIERLRNVINEVEGKANEIIEVLDGINLNKDELVLENNKAVENINSLNVLLENGNALKSNLSRLIQDAVNKSKDIEDLLNRVNVVKEELNELCNGANTIKNDLDLLVNSANESRVNLENAKSDVDEVIENINNNINIVNEAKNELNNLIGLANEINSNLDNKIDEANNKGNEVNGLIENINNLISMVNNTKNSLEEENNKAVENINELNPLNIEADENIEELKALIKEAKEIAIPALKAYIAEFAPAEDLTEVNLKLEELYNGLNELNIRFNSYYTKEEVDSKIDEKISLIDLSGFYNKEEVDKKFENKGIVGISKLPVCFTFAPEAGEEVKEIIWAKDRDGYCYVIHITVPNSNYHEMYLGPNLSQLKFYGREYIVYKWNGEEWVVVNLSSPTISMPYQERGITTSAILELIRNEHLFYCTLPVKEDGYSSYYFKEPIEKPNADICGDYNEVVLKGIYRISHNEEIPNCPTSVIEEGILDVKTVKDDINNIITVYQEVKTTNEKVYSRVRRRNNWSEWIEGGGASDIDLSSYYNKQETDNKIDEKINELLKDKVGLIGELIIPDFYKTAPASPFNNETHVVLRFKGNDGYNYIGYAKNNEGYPAYMKKSGTTERLYGGIDTNNCKFYKYNGSSWSFLNNNSIVMNTNTSLNDVYTNNVDIIYHSESDEQYRGNIWKKGIDDNVVVTNNYNNAIRYEKYIINQSENEVLNSPINGIFKGILLNDIVDNVIHQTVISDDNNIKYSRNCINGEWIEWKDEGEVDLSNYYNKEEIDEKFVKEIGKIKNGDPNFKEPEWDELPLNTFINIPANPDPEVYKWEMKCSHYGYHMVFYFPVNPEGKFGIVKRSDGKLGFKLLDSSFKYKEYKSYYKEKNSSTKWNNMPSDNHFLNPTTRELEAIYSHNFDIVDGDNPNVIFRYGSQNNFNDGFISDFNKAIKLEFYQVESNGEGIIENSPMTGVYKGILRVFDVNGMIHQTFENSKGETFKRLYIENEWNEWSKESQFDIEPNQYSERNGEYITNSLIELYNNNLRFEYGEYEVDSAKNSEHVANPEREYTDLIMLKAGGFKQVLGCMIFPHKLDFHYSIHCQLNLVLVNPSNKPDCLRLYIGYYGDRNEAFHPVNGLGRVKYCVFGY